MADAQYDFNRNQQGGGTNSIVAIAGPTLWTVLNQAAGGVIANTGEGLGKHPSGPGGVTNGLADDASGFFTGAPDPVSTNPISHQRSTSFSASEGSFGEFGVAGVGLRLSLCSLSCSPRSSPRG